jgi:O-antigen/teichoic acid export membrane protein
MLGFFKQASAAGIFFLSAKIGILVGYFLESANYIFAPVISDLHGQDRLEDVHRLYKAVNRLLISLTIPLCLFIMLHAREILSFFGSDYGAGVWIVYLVSVSQLVRASTGSSGYILVMTGEQNLVFRITVITAVWHLVLNLILIPKYGPTGAAISLSTSLILSNLLALYEVKRIHDINPFSRGLLKVGAGAVLIILTMICVKFVLSIDVMSSILSICVYVGFLYVLYLVILISLGLGQEERLVIGSVLGRVRKDNYGKQKV